MDLCIHSIPHRRFNPLKNEWVLVSPQRTQRPWQGRVEDASVPNEKPYDPQCYLCPGNVRARGVRNPDYSGTFIFDNDFPALLPKIPELEEQRSNLLLAQSEAGICRVLCFSPKHDLSVPRMSVEELDSAIRAITAEYRRLADVPWIRYIQVFENRGALMGASNPHPHCQIWATASTPNEVLTEGRCLSDYHRKCESCLLCDYLQLELKLSERVIFENDSFAVFTPFWAVWPFETLMVSKRHVSSIDTLDESELTHLSRTLKRLTMRYDNLFSAPFPYSMGFHQAQSGRQTQPEWHFHAHYYPPLLRSATVQKFMVGFELLGTPQRDFTPEEAATRLRDAAEVERKVCNGEV